MWVRVPLVLLAVATVIHVGEAVFMGRGKMDYLSKMKERNEQAKDRSHSSGSFDESWAWQYCPLWDCYDDCSEFDTCVQDAMTDPDLCICTLDDIFYALNPDSCWYYDLCMLGGEPASGGQDTCESCLKMMDQGGLSCGEAGMEFNCDREQTLGEVEGCFAAVGDTSCVNNRYGMDANMVFEGIQLQLDGCPSEEIGAVCAFEMSFDPFSGSLAHCVDIHDKIDQLVDCWEARVQDIDVCDPTETYIDAGRVALKAMAQSFCDNKEEAIAIKQQECACSAKKRHKNVNKSVKKTLRELLKILHE